MPFMDWFHNIMKPMSGVLVVAVALLLMATIEQAAARFGGFRGDGISSSSSLVHARAGFGGSCLRLFDRRDF
jgi:hypothetical protein